MNSTQSEKPAAAIVLTALGGAWMLASGFMMGAWGWPQGAPYGWMWGRGMMGGFGLAGSWPWFGAVAGIILLIGALLLAYKPEQAKGWGVLILIVSILNVFVGMGGLLAGLLGAAGGVLAIVANK